MAMRAIANPCPWLKIIDPVSFVQATRSTLYPVPARRRAQGSRPGQRGLHVGGGEGAQELGPRQSAARTGGAPHGPAWRRLGPWGVWGSTHRLVWSTAEGLRSERLL